MSDSHQKPEKPGEQAYKGLDRDLEDFERVRRILAAWALEPSHQPGVDKALEALARVQGELVRLRRVEYEVAVYVVGGYNTPARLRASIGMKA